MVSPRVMIVVLNWNGKSDTMRCIDSLARLDYPNFSILVVDNASEDDSVEEIEKRYPGIGIVENDHNLGYSGGNNVGITVALDEKADYAILLNNDTIVDPQSISVLVSAMEKDDKIGVAGPKVLWINQKSRTQSAGLRIRWMTGRTQLTKSDDWSNEDSESYDVDGVSGCAIMIRTDVIHKIGHLNETYFAYWEEIEFCTRAKRAGYRVVCVPDAKIWHGFHSSDRGKGIDQYYLARNRIWFMRSYSTAGCIIAFCCYAMLFDFWYGAFARIKQDRGLRSLRSYIKGYVDGIQFNPPKNTDAPPAS